MLKFRYLVVIMMMLSLMLPVGANAESPTLIYADSEKGVVWTSYTSPENKSVKLCISKGNDNYTYDVSADDRVPLQMGDGVYQILLLEEYENQIYRLIERKTLHYQAVDPLSVYLQSVQNIAWDMDMVAIQTATELTKDLESDEDKVAAIYQYVINHISYDHDKANTIYRGYIPSIESTFETQSGICYDYAALTAAMLRSVGIPTKLVMGSKNDLVQYHAWNEVYLKDTDEWIVIDTTYDAALLNGDVDLEMKKSASEYTATKHY